MELSERFADCMGGDGQPKEYRRHMALTEALLAIDSLTDRMRLLEARVKFLEEALDNAHIDRRPEYVRDVLRGFGR